MKKPPIGIMPKNVWESIRYNDLIAAIKRYLDANLPMPIEWLNEYNDFSNRLKTQ